MLETPLVPVVPAVDVIARIVRSAPVEAVAPVPVLTIETGFPRALTAPLAAAAVLSVLEGVEGARVEGRSRFAAVALFDLFGAAAVKVRVIFVRVPSGLETVGTLPRCVGVEERLGEGKKGL